MSDAQQLFASSLRIAVNDGNRRHAPSRPIPKKLSPELRKPRPSIPRGASWMTRAWLRLKNDSQVLRSTVQTAFALLCIWIGFEFHLFVKWGMEGTGPYVERPPGVEGFLPISALMSLKHWIEGGVLNEIHPASVFVL